MIKETILFNLDRLKRVSFYFFLYIFRWFVPIKKGRVFCWAYFMRSYSCNPRFISESLLKSKNADDYDIIWAFKDLATAKTIPSEVREKIKIVKYFTLRYAYYMSSAQFIIYNTRAERFDDGFSKKPGQFYIMTWHASMGLKPAENDVVDSLPKSYVKRAKRDSEMCDLMLSGTKFQTNNYRDAYWYDGEILEKGTPRNDVFFDLEYIESARKNVISKLKIPFDSLLVLYAPTFRRDGSLDVYRINWNLIIDAFYRKYKKNVYVLLKLHPNLYNVNGIESLINSKNVINVTKSGDIQDFICASDCIISDYSSCLFDMSYLRRPCYIYAPDYESYDRGSYFDLKSLPFSFATSEDQLIENINLFNKESYLEKLDEFFNNEVGLVESGNACKEFEEWMRKRM